MRSIQRRLYSERDTLFLITLLFFLVCLTMGSLILTTATANVIKARDRYEDQQNYLTAASAARLIKDTIRNYTYTEEKAWQSRQTGIDPATDLPIVESGWRKITPLLLPDNEGDPLTDAYDDMRGLIKYRGSFEIRADEGMPDVRTEFTMEQGSDVTIMLTAGKYSMTVSFTTRTAHTTDHTTYDYCKTSWSSGVTTKGTDQMRRKRSSSGETLVETLAVLLLVVLSGMLFLQMTMASTRMSTQPKKTDTLYQKVLTVVEQQTSPAFSIGSIDTDGRSYNVHHYAYSGASSGEKLVSYAQYTGDGGWGGQRAGCVVVSE